MMMSRHNLYALEIIVPPQLAVECEGSAACLAARVRHGDPPVAFWDRVRRLGAARGWAVTVASGRPLG